MKLILDKNSVGRYIVKEIPSEIELWDLPIYRDNQNIITNMNSTQWKIGPNGAFIPTTLTCQKLPPGFYEPVYDNQVGIHYKHMTISSDDLYILPTTEYKSILTDLETFWTRGDIFKQNGFIHKRGILMYGDPGCGKSALIQLIGNAIIKDHEGIVINISDDDQLSYYIDSIDALRQIEPNTPIVVILEDLDEIAGDSKYGISQVLNILDGVKQVNNVVYLATTNYPEKLEDRISNRPSRFDRKYKIELPNIDVRTAFFKAKLGEDFKDLKQWALDSEGLSLAHCKEMIISTVLLGNTYEHTKEQLGILKSSGKRKVSGFQK